MPKRCITVGQLFCMLFISRMIVNLTYSPIISSSNSMWDHIISAIISFFITFLLVIPVYFICNKREPMNIADISCFLLGKIGLIFVFVYAIYYIFVCIYTLSLFDDFVANVMNPKTPIILMSSAIMLTAAYGAYKGIEALVRTSGFILFLIVVASLFIIITLLPNIDKLNYEPLMYYGNGNVVNGILLMISMTSCIPAMAMLIPLTKGNVKKGILLWNIAVYFSISIFIVVIVGALGDYLKTQMFPIYTATTIAGIGFLKNLDALYLGIWTTGLFIKISLFLLLFSMCVKRIFGNKAARISILLGAIIITILSNLVINYRSLSNFIYNINFLLSFTLLTSFLIPLILLIVDYIKAERRKKIEES